ncbi:hypothetical protein COLO4_13481 [Corchorus olitorius]|uniref:Uncharacterized protein n=1 Tax=Corchorus olitorius TaxID=93759 RepID=A0A1R3JWD7_9ROSI|nr:hypothetical protein COLO4_13481 [Corchorus olitorius]
MFSKGLVGYFLLILLSISALNNHGVLGARFLADKLEDHQEMAAASDQKTWKEENPDKGIDGFFATINREVPSCPDPLHNR